MARQLGAMRSSNPLLTPEFKHVDLTALGSPRFVLTVDTEEEFDWSKPFARDGFGTTHMRAVPRFQALCDDHGITPCYLVDYPIIEDAYGADLLSGYAEDSRAEIGVQLHPWVNPPFDEALNSYNSYACNLPPALERAKLTQLHSAIVSRMGVKPDAYRAGRYGAGAATPDILQDLGISIDSSVRARFDYSSQHGPDFSAYPVRPYWIRHNSLIELPVTTVYSGVMRAAGSTMFSDVFGSRAARSTLSRCNMLERIALTPEGIPLDKALLGIDLALADKVPVINLSLHSPSLAVGHTPYVRDAGQLEQLYNWLHGVFCHLRNSGVRPTTMAEIVNASRFKSFR